MHFLLTFQRTGVSYGGFFGRGRHRYSSKVPVEKVCVMQYESFDLFAEKIITMPAKAILGALDLDCKLLEQDLAQFRASFADDEYSILCFRQFIRSARSGVGVFPRQCLPPNHLALYKHTVVRLVHEDQLPTKAMEHFRGAFIPEACS